MDKEIAEKKASVNFPMLKNAENTDFDEFCNLLDDKKENIQKIANENLSEDEKTEKILKYNKICSLLDDKKERISKYNELNILANEKLALPFTSIVFTLIAIPLSITGPRARFNRGLLFSIGVLFIFYFLRAVSLSLGLNEIIPFFIAAWLPNIVLFTIGYLLYKRKVYNI